MSAGVAVVTGAARGIGAAVAARLVDEGHRVLLVDLDPAVAATADEVGGAGACVADITSGDGVAAVAADVRAAGGLDVLVNNAGITRDGRVADLDAAAFRAVIDVNLVGAMRLTLGLEDEMRDGARVVTMASRAALGNFGQANYVAAKAGLLGFTRALALRWAPRVRVNAVAPGLIDTPMTRQMPERVLAKLVDRIPAARIGTPEDVADVVAFLASGHSDYVTGQVVVACGGRSLAP